MQTAAIVIEFWKLDTFRKRLEEAGVNYTEHDGPVSGAITLKVEVSDVDAITYLVNRANAECMRHQLH